MRKGSLISFLITLLPGINLSSHKIVIKPETTYGKLPDIIDIESLDLLAYLHDKPHVTKWKCLGPLGCFSNGYPYYHPEIRPLSLLPYDPDNLGVQFFLYTKTNTRLPQILREDDPQSLRDSSFDNRLETKIYAHGLGENINSRTLIAIRNALILNGNLNVIIVDWSRSSRNPYEQAIANLRAVGVKIALLIKSLRKNVGMNTNKLHLIGHSLGAQLMGSVGQVYPGLPLITGLDPAGPMFDGLSNGAKLDPSDAKYVEVIHTNAATFIAIGVGAMEQNGDVNFFPNGGIFQGEACQDTRKLSTILMHGSLEGFGNRIYFCSHQLSVFYYAETFVNRDCQPVGLECQDYYTFLSGKCGDCGIDGQRCKVMGQRIKYNHNQEETVLRKYYLKMAPTAPYCLHQYHVVIKVANDSPKVIGEFTIVMESSIKPWKIINKKLRTQKYVGGESYHFLIANRLEMVDLHEVVLNFKAIYSWKPATFRPDIEYVTISLLQTSQRNLKKFCPKEINKYLIKLSENSC